MFSSCQRSPGAHDGPVWTVVADPAGIRHWRTARCSAPALLDEPGVTFLRGPGGAVVGLSNLVADGEPDRAWAGAVRAIATHHPGRPIVGYDRGDDLAATRRAGFGVTGPLRVWIKD